MPNPEHIHIISQGVDAWNQWRKHDSQTPDLREAVLTGRDFRGANFSGADLSFADLSKAILSRADLSDAKLVGANLTGGSLAGAKLNCAELQFVILEKANLSEVNLSDLDLSHANLTNASASSGLLLKKATLKHATLNAAYFQYADLTGANLTDAKLRGIDLRGSILREATLERADLRESFLNSIGLDSRGIETGNMRFPRVDLQRANLSGADIRGAKLVGADLREANLTNADFKDSDLSDAQLDRADLRGARNFLLSRNSIRATRFDARVNDPWSVLRRTYSGQNMIFSLLILAVFLAPYFGKLVYWAAVNYHQDHAEAIHPQVSDVAKDYLDEKAFPLADMTSGRIYMAERIAQSSCFSHKCTELSTLSLILGFGDEKRVWWVPLWVLTSIMIAFNLAKGILTWRIGPLRDEEERSGYAPTWVRGLPEPKPFRHEEDPKRLPRARLFSKVFRFAAGLVSLIKFKIKKTLWELSKPPIMDYFTQRRFKLLRYRVRSVFVNAIAVATGYSKFFYIHKWFVVPLRVVAATVFFYNLYYWLFVTTISVPAR